MDPSEEAVKCHGKEDCGRYTEAEVIKKLGYMGVYNPFLCHGYSANNQGVAVVLPHPVDTEEGQRSNKKWVAHNNKTAREKAEQFENVEPTRVLSEDAANGDEAIDGDADSEMEDMPRQFSRSARRRL
jgi:hypothetical protein